MAEYGPYRRYIQKNYNTLRRDLRADEVVAILYQNDHLTEEEREEITSNKNKHKRNQQLLDFLTGEEACRCFFEALADTSQAHLQAGFEEERQATQQSDEGAVGGASTVGDTNRVRLDSRTCGEDYLYQGVPYPRSLSFMLYQYDPRRYDALTENEYGDFVRSGLTEETIQELNCRSKGHIDEKIDCFFLPENIPDMSANRTSDISVVFIGRSRDGKSTTANTLIGEKVFETGTQEAGVTECVKFRRFVHEGRKYRVVDTPGLADLEDKNEQIALVLAKVMDECRDGVHVFMYVRKASDYRFSREHQKVKKFIEDIFGPPVFDHTTVILTHSNSVFDEKESLASYLENTLGKCSELGKFMKTDINKRVVAIENKCRVHYERERMRALLFDTIDHQLRDIHNEIYTPAVFSRAQEISQLSRTDQTADMGLLQERSTMSFDQSYESAKKDALEVVSNFWRDRKYSQASPCSDNDLDTIVDQLHEYLKERKPEVLKDLECLQNESNYPIRDIVECCLHIGKLRHLSNLARERGDKNSRDKYDAMLAIYKAICKQSQLESESDFRQLKRELNGEDFEREFKTAKLFLKKQLKYHELIRSYLEDVDAVIGEELQVFVRKMSYAQWKNIGDAEYQEIYLRVIDKINKGAANYLSESEILGQVTRKMENKSQQLDGFITFILQNYNEIVNMARERCTII